MKLGTCRDTQNAILCHDAHLICSGSGVEILSARLKREEEDRSVVRSHFFWHGQRVSPKFMITLG